MAVLGADAEQVGEVASGTFSPTLKTGIALALVDPSRKLGDPVSIDIRGRSSEFKITKPPFVTPGVKKS
jgi:aminomethyltransferase